MSSARRIYLMAPHMGGNELRYVTEAFTTNWLSTVGANIDSFERDLENRVGRPCVALGSGTAALHLAMRLVGVGPGDAVVCPTLTFVASVNPILYQGALPIFVDSERESWNLDPVRLDEALTTARTRGETVRAVVVVHLFGQCADMDRIDEVCRRHGVAIIEDAAEALGASYHGRPAGSLAKVSAFSFNGNKIITTTGGGMLAAEDAAWVAKARHWSTQAREPGVEYHHVEMGYNYRMSNVLAGIGRGQLEVLDERVARHRAIMDRYTLSLGNCGFEPMPEPADRFSTRWLSVFLVDPTRFDRDEVIACLATHNIEARPVWKPMHMQPLYASSPCFGGLVAEDLFARGICLPSTTSMTDDDQDRVVSAILSCRKS